MVRLPYDWQSSRKPVNEVSCLSATGARAASNSGVLCGSRGPCTAPVWDNPLMTSDFDRALDAAQSRERASANSQAQLAERAAQTAEQG